MSAAQKRTQDFSSGNRLQLLVAGVAYFPALIAAIDGAAHEVHLETYIFADDATGRSVAAALSRAARRGVTVRVLIDGFGAREFAAGLGRALAADGAKLLTYRPEIPSLRIRRHRLRRLHRKLAVIDGRTAFVGGINVIHDFDNEQATAPRFDYAVSVEGPLVARIHAAVRHLWHLVSWSRLGHRVREPDFLPPRQEPAGAVQAAFLIRDNLRHRRDIEDAYLDAITNAQQEIMLANAYFLPGRRFREALLAAAQRGVHVTLLLQGRVEYAFQHHATQSLYDRLLAANVRIFEYQPAFLHAKVAVIDGAWATVGSSNIDPFSLLLSREANVVVRDTQFAAELGAHLRAAIRQDALEIHRDDQGQRSWLLRLFNNTAYMLVRLLVSMTHYSR